MSMPTFNSASLRRKNKLGMTVSALAALLALSACGGGGGGDTTEPPPAQPEPVQPAPEQPPPEQPPPVQPPPAEIATPRIACAALLGQTIPAASIGLPTSGAEVTGAEIVAPTAQNPIEYCKVTGAIRPTEQGDRDILFQLNLPAEWNLKGVQMGGSGFGGTVVAATGQLPFTQNTTTPLSQRYATFGSDTGHAGEGPGFALDNEALVNFGGQHLKKTRDTAVAILNSYYAAQPNRMYIGGGSTGGREALAAIQRWPADYDGAIASAPTANFTGLRLNGIRIGQANYAPGGFLSADERALVRQTSIAACDMLDGLSDGLVGNVPACRARSEQTLTELRCTDGNNDSGASCLSDEQIATIRTAHTDLVLPYRLANNVDRFEGYNVLEGAGTGLGTNPALQNPPTVQDNGNLFATGSSWIRLAVARNAPSFNVMEFDPVNPGQYLPRIQEVSGITDATNPDLQAFQARGGKLIMMHGLSDTTASPNSTIAYYNQVVGTLGQAQVDTFIRFYTVPGFDHGGGAFSLRWDPLTALDNWVSTNSPPGVLIGTDTNASNGGRTRPLCPYPAYPSYVSGSATVAASFNCVNP